MRVVTLGTLREDIVLEYDFSVPMNCMETEIKRIKKSIGGSVHNTCYYLASYNPNIEVILCTLNYFHLVEILKASLQCENYSVLTPQEALLQSPISIVGIKSNGEKQIISYDPETEADSLINLFEREMKEADLIYSSFYEVKQDYGQIVRILGEAIKTKKMIMMDLCPLLSRIDSDAIRSIISNVTIISGNEDEYELLAKIIGYDSITSLFSEFPNLKRIYVKRVNRGASLYIQTDLGEIREVYIAVTGKCYTVTNTNGCGDVFNAVLIDGILRKEDPEIILEKAIVESGRIAEGGLPWTRE